MNLRGVLNSIIYISIPFHAIIVNGAYRIIPTRHVWRPWVIFLRQGIHYVPPPRDGVVVAGAVVVPVETMGAVELFANVFVGLGGGIAAVAHQPAEWIIVVHLLYVAIGKTDGDAVVAYIVHL